MKICIAQLNPTIGDIQGNMEKIITTLTQCNKNPPDIVIFPELFLVGYPPRDLLQRPWFNKKTQQAINQLIIHSTNYPKTGILIGTPLPTNKETGKGLYNSAIFIHDGNLRFTQHKSLLPTYDVFDEARYFDPAPTINVFSFKEETLGISICEDAWNNPELWPQRYYPTDPQEHLAKLGATIFINISSSPFHIGKEKIRYRLFQNHAKKHKVPFISVNQIGGNDELIFDGRSMVFDDTGTPIIIFPSFKEHVQTIDIHHPKKSERYQPQNEIVSIYEALILGIRDYMRKCDFSTCVLGLSGGIDSAVACCLATAAIGKENILGVTMPGPYSSKGSVEDSMQLAKNLGIQFDIIPISSLYNAYIKSLEHLLKLGGSIEVTHENIQARIRGNILMAISNKKGYLVLSAGNKSELAVGYCTLYGDMTGGLAVLSDVPKTMVYQLAHLINKNNMIIPESIIDKPPSAELKPDQQDQDALPPYDVLDPILEYYIDQGYSPDDIVNLNYDSDIVRWVIQTVDRNEYKRRQVPPGLKVTPKAFGIGRRMPIAAKYRI